MYPPDLVAPMSKELNDVGVESLTNADAVHRLFDKKEGTFLLVVNSVCGCAAANARPGVKISLQNEKKPDHAYTVFAGVDTEATKIARDYMQPYPPSSPSIALFKNGELVHFLERHHIEGRSAQIIADNLKMAYEHYC
ncbi:MAG: BrxA/BrxB family bacilliredoxin [Saprospiraceae bacterium]|jgi:putative YphP/YqiW family bacilliredoxin|nr:BrxA/BrxB family bacilliredoxin [Saprospiraceae bacterium]